MRPVDFNVEEVIEELRGSCKTLAEVLPEGMTEFDLTKEDHEAIDTEIFKCDQCDWWHGMEDEADHEGDYSGYCKGCAGED